MNNYNLNQTGAKKAGAPVWQSLAKMWPYVKSEKKHLQLSGVAVLINSGLNLLAPVLIGRAVDVYIQAKQFHGVLVYAAILLAMYVVALITNYFQTMYMGTVGQHVLFNLRNAIFNKVQSLPVAFFNQNKAGDLISRINNDTDKLNMFFSQSLIRFLANIISIIGAAIFMLVINWRVGLMALIPAVLLMIFTQLISPWIKKQNTNSMKTTGGLSAEISESLDNFKVIVAFNRRDYFRKKFMGANETNYTSAIKAGIANNTLVPTYGFASSIAQLVVMGYGIYLITTGLFTVGLLISFLSYITRLYDPLREIANIWTIFQTALASWDRISDILSLQTDLVVLPAAEKNNAGKVLEFKDVNFQYPNGKEVLHHINFALEPGKTYALVGPTGGGKTTTASLMARLYDPTSGTVLLQGRDIRSYDEATRAQKIGFILQEPFLFTGTIRENILYGSEMRDGDELEKVLAEAGLESLLTRFDGGLDTKVSATGGALSLGQKQLIAFIRAVLRRPDVLILDEATANIDTVTEQLLEEILQKLPSTTAKVIIAHRLNTIANADEIFFVNAGEVVRAGSMEQAMNLLLRQKRDS